MSSQWFSCGNKKCSGKKEDIGRSGEGPDQSPSWGGGDFRAMIFSGEEDVGGICVSKTD